MFRSDGENTLEDANGAGKDGFSNGNPTVPVGATVIDAAWLNEIQEELANLAELSDRTLEKGNRTQLWETVGSPTRIFRDLIARSFTHATAAEANTWRDVCWSEELGIFCAVAEDGTNRVMTSPDGITWTVRTAAEANAWNGICWAAELSLFVAVAGSGTNRVMTSPDGTTWTPRAASGASDWRKVCYSPELNLFVAVAQSGTDRIMTSPTGTTWTARTAPSTNSWNDVCWSPELSLFCATAQSSGSNRIMTSSDGITWVARTNSNLSAAICWSPELGLFATAGNDIATSPDGITWTVQTVPTTTPQYRDICWSPELGMFIATVGNNEGFIIYSMNGVDWYERTTPETNTWSSICWSPALSRFVSVADSGSGRVMFTAMGGLISGSYIESVVAEGAIGGWTTDNAKNITSLTLPPGDWELSAFGSFAGGAITGTASAFSISTVSVTIQSACKAQVPLVPTATSEVYLAVPTRRVRPTVATTYYLTGLIKFTGGTPTGGGTLIARNKGRSL